MNIHSDLGELISAVWPHMRQLHASGDLAPVAASTDRTGEIGLLAILVEDKKENDPAQSVASGLKIFETAHREAASKGEIVASGIFFHGATPDEPLRPATTAEEAGTLVSLLEHETGDSLSIVIPYQISGDEIRYGDPIFNDKSRTVFGKKATTIRW